MFSNWVNPLPGKRFNIIFIYILNPMFRGALSKSKKLPSSLYRLQITRSCFVETIRFPMAPAFTERDFRGVEASSPAPVGA